MGSWIVQSCQGAHTPLDGNVFGHNFRVRIRMEYQPSKIGRFKEPPILAWDETILYNDYGDNTRWHFAGNMYKMKPASPTVSVWGQRYYRAYLNAHNTPYFDYGKEKGYSKLLDNRGIPVPGAVLGVHNDKDAQNEAVRSYLKRNGGILQIEVHDIPGMSTANNNAERVLIFNCGVTGMGPRVKCWQHIRIDTNQPRTTWMRNFQMGANAPGLKTTGLRVVSAPIILTPALASGAVNDF